MKTNIVTQEQVLEWLEYHEDGYLLWKRRPSRNTPVGKRFGSDNGQGYIIGNLCGVRMRQARLVFLYHHGYLPDEVDHVNRVRSDDRIENLRAANRTSNNRNRCTTGTASTGFSGVYETKAGRFVARLRRHGKYITLGPFDEVLDAVDARANFIDNEI